MYERGAKCNKPGRSYPGKYSHPKRRSCLLLVSLLVNLVNLSLSSPIYSQQFANFQTGRNIRHLPCVARKTGLKGICMFAIDCLKSNGTHLGTCIDKFYFGSCCQLQPDEDSVFQHEITDNSIDQSVLSTLLHTSPARPLIPVSTISVPARRNSTEPSVPSTVESTTRKTSNSSFTTENIRLSTFQMVEVAPKSTTPKSRPSTLSDLPSSSLPQSSSTLTTRGQPQTTKYSAKPSVDTRPTKPQTTPEKPRPTLSATTHSLPTTYRNLTNRATTKAPRPKPRPTAEIAIVPPSTLADLEFTTVQFVSSSAKTTPSPMSILNSTSWSTNPSPSPTRRTTNKRVPSSTAPSIARTTPKETEPSTAYWTTLGSSLSTNRLTQRTTETPKTTQKTAAPTKPPPTTTRVKTTPSGSTIFVKVETTSPRRPVTTTKVPTTVILKDSSPYSSSTFAKKPATATIERVTTTPKPRPKPTKLQDFKVTTAKPTKAAATSPVVRTTTPKPKPPATTSTTQAAKTTVTEAPLTSKAPEKPPTTVSTSQKPEFVTWTMLDDSTEPAPEAVNWVLVSGEPTQTSTKPTQPSTKPTQPSAKPVQSSTQPTQTSTRSTTAATTTTQSSTTTTTSTAAPTTTPKTTRRTTTATTTTKRPTTTPTTTQSTTRRTTTSTTTSTTPPTTTTTTSTLPPTTTKRVSAPIVEDTATPILLLQDSSEESYTTERIIGTSTSTSIQVNPVPHTTDPTVAATEEHTQNVTAGETVEFSTENLFEYNATIPSLVSLFNSTVAPEFLTPSTTSMPQLEGIDYRTICGKRMFPEPRIVGGAKASFGRWPWQISLRQWRTSTYLHKCGAALLNENWAITAAHCVDNVPPSDLLLRLGEYDLAIEEEPYGYQERRVQIVASHPQFDPRTFEYDLALLRFYEPVIFQPNIIPVCVPENDENFIGRSAYVTGWGRLYEDGPLPSVLQEVTVPVIENSICEGMYRAAGYIEHIPHIFICAGWKKGGFDSCEGDSGGPMVIQRPDKRFLLAGIISWGIGCAEPNQPGVYTRISEFRDWINQILQF